MWAFGPAAVGGNDGGGASCSPLPANQQRAKTHVHASAAVDRLAVESFVHTIIGRSLTIYRAGKEDQSGPEGTESYIRQNTSDLRFDLLDGFKPIAPP
jgi:hypothetical protein